jgi:hypothetical protein
MKITLTCYWPRPGIYLGEMEEELESMEFLALVAKGAKGGVALPGELYALHLVLVLR